MSEQVDEPVEPGAPEPGAPEPDEPRVDEDGGAASDGSGSGAPAAAPAERSADDTDTGWGEVLDAEQHDREHWLRAERPPHWG